MSDGTLTLIVEVEGGRAIAQDGSFLYPLSPCCRAPYDASPKWEWPDGSEGASLCSHCSKAEPPLWVDPAVDGAWWAVKIPLDETRVSEAQIVAWASAWLGVEVESVQVQTS